MTATGLIVAALLVVGVGVVWLGCAGLLVTRGVYDRLHCLGPAALIGPVAIAAALAVAEGPGSSTALKAGLAAIFIGVTNPLLAHATARAARVRERGDLALAEAEVAEEARP